MGIVGGICDFQLLQMFNECLQEPPMCSHECRNVLGATTAFVLQELTFWKIGIHVQVCLIGYLVIPCKKMSGGNFAAV